MLLGAEVAGLAGYQEYVIADGLTVSTSNEAVSAAGLITEPQ